MVKLSEILRKASKDAELGEKTLFGDVLDQEKEVETKESEKVYNYVAQRLDQTFAEIRENKIINGKELISLAGMLVEGLMIDSDVLQELANNSHKYSNGSPFLPTHSVNVSVITTNLGFAFDVGKDILIDLCTAALIHDVGMLIIPQEIIQKPEKLTDKEYELIKMHPSYGIKFMNNIKNLPAITEEIILQHHEKINGKGYPKGLRGESISKFAQIVGIAEIFEAISHPRPYRSEKIDLSEAVKLIIQEESSSFEKDVLRALMHYITIFPVGCYVKLNNQEVGIVKSINRNFPLRPVIEIVQNSKGKPLKDPKIVDMSKAPILFIEEAVGEESVFHG